MAFCLDLPNLRFAKSNDKYECSDEIDLIPKYIECNRFSGVVSLGFGVN